MGLFNLFKTKISVAHVVETATATLTDNVTKVPCVTAKAGVNDKLFKEFVRNYNQLGDLSVSLKYGSIANLFSIEFGYQKVNSVAISFDPNILTASTIFGIFETKLFSFTDYELGESYRRLVDLRPLTLIDESQELWKNKIQPILVRETLKAEFKRDVDTQNLGSDEIEYVIAKKPEIYDLIVGKYKKMWE